MSYTFERRNPDGAYGAQPIIRSVSRGTESGGDGKRNGIVPGPGRRAPAPPPPPRIPPHGGGGVSQKPK
ncbi:MAG: hypothetical protein L0H03_21940 [Rhodococcus sp. (in: high G+C Gram-positive bacteria)]|nr:hypothetical protein [Rhodococcus sp. (in: high G+C Gram-positive bacteria)]